MLKFVQRSGRTRTFSLVYRWGKEEGEVVFVPPLATPPRKQMRDTKSYYSACIFFFPCPVAAAPPLCGAMFAVCMQDECTGAVACVS